MKWFKHIVDSGDDPDIGEILDKFGPRGYYMFFRTLEIMAREFDIHDPGRNTFKLRWLITRYRCRVSVRLLQDFFKLTTRLKRIKCRMNGNAISLNCPKLKELADEYTEKTLRKIGTESRQESGQCREQKEIKKKKKNKKEKIKNEEVSSQIIKYLNEKTGKEFSSKSQASIDFINGRLADSRSLGDFKRVIDIKVDQWKDDPKMSGFLRPSTLFRPTNFENYLNETLIIPTGKSSYTPSKEDEQRQITIESYRKTLMTKYRPEIDKAKKAGDLDTLQGIEETIRAEVAQKSQEI